MKKKKIHIFSFKQKLHVIYSCVSKMESPGVQPGKLHPHPNSSAPRQWKKSVIQHLRRTPNCQQWLFYYHHHHHYYLKTQCSLSCCYGRHSHQCTNKVLVLVNCRTRRENQELEMQQAESKENKLKAWLNMLSLECTLMILGGLANKSEFTVSATYLFISPFV